MAASSLCRSKTYLGAKFRRLRARLGAPKAITAMAHMLARLVYRMLRYGEQYVDKTMKYYEEKYREHEIRSIQKKAKDLGLVVTLTTAAYEKFLRSFRLADITDNSGVGGDKRKGLQRDNSISAEAGHGIVGRGSPSAVVSSRSVC
jgi:hypothetical protein